ncbi:MAG TPA: energy transducer TonB [Terriglobales bacterium]|nr:energy transducer TonB [Terriglobales bacterium]
MTKLPTGVILVKGAWASASDSTTPLPEGGSVNGNVFTDEYFGITYAAPKGWTERYQGPPPSDSGGYVLAQIQPHTPTDTTQGHILVTAQDMFFTPLPTENALELIAYQKDNLQSDYQLEVAPRQTKIAGRPFTFFAYSSPVAKLHWYVLGTEIRCHAVEFVLTSRDTKLLESLVADMNRMQLPAKASPSGGEGGGAFPVCIKDYAEDENLIARADPILTEHRFTPVPVRIIIDKNGKVKHIHFLSAYPDEEKVITDALLQWKFKPYLKDGQPVEVETGIMFGRAPRPLMPSQGAKLR